MTLFNELLTLASQIEHAAESAHNRAMLRQDEDSRRIKARMEEIMQMAHDIEAKVREVTGG